MPFMIYYIFAIVILTSNVTTQAETLAPLSPVKLEGEQGGYLDGRQWSDAELPGKVTILMYVDPDVRDRNEPFSQKLQEQNYPAEMTQSFAIINMAATWIPNIILDAIIEKKQQQYPTTKYILDLDKHLVRQWQLKDDEYNVLLFNPRGELIFFRAGKITDQEEDALIQQIWEMVNKGAEAVNGPNN